jgi:hypothetical protein
MAGCGGVPMEFVCDRCLSRTLRAATAPTWLVVLKDDGGLHERQPVIRYDNVTATT